MATVQLRQPALLASGKWNKETGRMDLSQSEIDRILAEQAEFELRLQHISEEIEVIFRYRLVLNGMSLSVPVKYRERFRAMAETASLSTAEPVIIERLPVQEEANLASAVWGEMTSVGFIEAQRAHEELGITGRNITVGVVDTGIDYTHAMFGGPGTTDYYQTVDPSIIDSPFPTEKVIGGYDFVGSEFNSGSSDWRQRFPRPDPDPLDESGHGTHVAGTIAGIGDGINTYDGVAPDALLYALKVFGNRGSTNDAIVIASLEYAANPSGDFDLSDRLDVVNLSLGGGYGVPNGLYDLAVQNLTRGGTVAVISAGNSGDVPYIVASPSTSEAAISVAASVDAMHHNWRDRASEVTFDDGNTELVAMVAGTITSNPIGFSAKSVLMHDIGFADEDLSANDQAVLEGRLALIERGVVSFCEKGQRAQDAAAIGFVMINSDDGSPTSMGGDCRLSIPGVMIPRELGLRIRAELEAGLHPRFTMDSGQWIENPARIDRLTGFSSRGPRSWDGLFKPEITAPGQAIVSAGVGGGDAGVRMGGTSMSAPHVAGVAALLKERFPTITNSQVKSRLMTTAVTLYEDEDRVKPYPLSRQGAGRVDTYQALTTELTLDPPLLSLGHVLVDSSKVLMERVEITNHSDRNMDISFAVEYQDEWNLINARPVQLAAGQSRVVPLAIQLSPDTLRSEQREVDGFIVLRQDGESGPVMARLPLMGVLTRVAQVEVDSFQVYSSSAADSAGAFSSVKLTNDSDSIGYAIPMNPLGRESRKTGIINNPARSHLCDLESVGYRVLDRWTSSYDQPILEFGIKLYHPITTWNLCTLVVFFDRNGDGIADVRLLNGQLEELTEEEQRIYRQAASQGDMSILAPLWNRAEDEEPSPLLASDSGLETFDFSSLALMRTSLEQLQVHGQRKINAQVLVYARSSSADSIDILRNEKSKDWWAVPINGVDAPWQELPDRVRIRPGDFDWLDFRKGFGHSDLLIYFPQNASSESISLGDEQSAWLRPVYGT